jgi:hypothetical protein
VGKVLPLVFLNHFSDIKHFGKFFPKKIAEVVKSTQEKTRFSQSFFIEKMTTFVGKTKH